jgi:DNA topoisomerase-1
LRYVSDEASGIARRCVGPAKRGAFRYVAPGGRPVRDRAALARIRALAIPPAWESVWICPHDDGHIQATGRDARGRKQYRYHQRWRELRDETKFGRMAAFGRALPRIRRRVRRDLARPGLPREKALATLVRLLETTFIRVGNEEYARQNESYGLTTLRERQVRVQGATLKFRFRGKSGVEHSIELSDPKLAQIVRRMQDLPGEELFQYLDEQGERRGIESADVNAYLKDISGDEFTSKDFRTWAGTLLAARALRSVAPAASGAEAKRNVGQAIEWVAGRLGNTKAVCRKCYIHPAVLESYAAGTLAEALRRRPLQTAIVALLEKHARRETELAGAAGRSLAPLLSRSLAISRRRSRTRFATKRRRMSSRAPLRPSSSRRPRAAAPSAGAL